MAKIKVIQPEEAEGELKNIYQDIISSRGKIAEVHKIQSLNPQSIVNHMDLYQTVMFGQSPLKRVQREMGDLLRLEFSDTGHGIAPQHLKEIFDPFFSTKEGNGGTGLGLFISRKIVENYQMTRAP